MAMKQKPCANESERTSFLLLSWSRWTFAPGDLKLHDELGHFVLGWEVKDHVIEALDCRSFTSLRTNGLTGLSKDLFWALADAAISNNLITRARQLIRLAPVFGPDSYYNATYSIDRSY
jgi:hypothetical protein